MAGLAIRARRQEHHEVKVLLSEASPLTELGVPVLADTIDLTVESLREPAQEQAIPGRSTMGHDELAATVSPS